MKLTRDCLKQIRTEARNRIGGFGMWIELQEKVGYIGKEQVFNFNLLFTHDKGTSDLHDFVGWSSMRSLEIESINGFAWLDFCVHDSEELKDNLHVLVDAKGNFIKAWCTWADEKELHSLILK